jgi:hypothetical protein
VCGGRRRLKEKEEEGSIFLFWWWPGEMEEKGSGGLYVPVCVGVCMGEPVNEQYRWSSK